MPRRQFNIVPSNRQEHLLTVLIELLKHNRTDNLADAFRAEQVIVESMGMKHYVNMGIAKALGVAMNIDFPLVSRAIYNLAREILGEDKVATESIYKREILVWRITQILTSESFCAHPDAVNANAYWQNNNDVEHACYMLAQQTADVFEQYMQFRPDWLAQWETSMPLPDATSQVAQTLEPWQRLIWQSLLNDDAAQKQPSLYPSKILREAIDAFRPGQHALPKRLFIFIVNALTPDQIRFLETISADVEIYFFHLNPCVEYWGDLVSQKAQVRQLLESGMDAFLNSDSGNPLLANLGAQGRILFKQLQGIDYPDFTDGQLFVDAKPTASTSQTTLLEHIQNDILKAQVIQRKLASDNTVSIHSCHNPLREIQVLHDQLLHLMNTNHEIQPHDIIVLCPAVEEYASYVKSVFRDVSEPAHENNPRLVCSISDRAPLDAEPLVAMFLQMLDLPDSRFSANALIKYLHIEAVQKRFDLSAAEVQMCQEWIAQANIFWGADGGHQRAVLDGKPVDDKYSWAWGLSRLLKSALFSDQFASQASFAMTHNIEGLNIHTLGKLVSFIEAIQHIHGQLSGKKNADEWIRLIEEDILNAIFAQDAQIKSLQSVKSAIKQVSDNLNKAAFNQSLSLSMMREAMTGFLSTPDPLNQFNTGQVTFCSMVPMRSVPFKVVCILGLNDGVFPRMTQPLSVDLMAQLPAQLGDRQRRNEDRYMFLEAILSAREYLYLSYQGRNHKNNAKREPSLVLAEFMQYLKDAFNCEPHYEHALQPFSPKSFVKENLTHPTFALRPSYASAWHDKAQLSYSDTDRPHASYELPNKLDAETLASFFNDPLGSFARHQLGLTLPQYHDVQAEAEPFSVSPLINYQLNTAVVRSAIENSTEYLETELKALTRSGDFPILSELHNIDEQIYALIKGEIQTSIEWDPLISGEPKSFSHQLDVEQASGETLNITLYTQMAVDEAHHTNFFLHNSAKNKDLFQFILQHAIKRLSSNLPVQSKLRYIDIKLIKEQYLDYLSGSRKTQPEVKIQTLALDDDNFPPVDISAFITNVLTYYVKGMSQATLLHADFGFKLYSFRDKDGNSFDNDICIEKLLGLYEKEASSDPFLQYFYPDGFAKAHIDIVALRSVYIDYLPNNWGIK